MNRCRSVEDVAGNITTQYQKTLRNPKIVVTILDRSNRALALLLGAIKKPQRFRIQKIVKLNEVLALSGGIVETASGDISIFRPPSLNCASNDKSMKENGTSTIHIRISDLISGSPDANPIILSGDIITVAEAPPIYIIGGVNTPRGIPSRSDLSLSRAVSSAGGLASDAVENEITIYRRESKETRIISADLRKIESKQQEDLLLKPFDVVEVGQKGRARSKFPPAIGPDSTNRDPYKLPVRVID